MQVNVTSPVKVSTPIKQKSTQLGAAGPSFGKSSGGTHPVDFLGGLLAGLFGPGMITKALG